VAVAPLGTALVPIEMRSRTKMELGRRLCASLPPRHRGTLACR